MGFWGTMIEAGITGWQAGIAAARRVFDDPESAHTQEMFIQREAEYQILWALYNSSMFDSTSKYMHAFTGSWMNNRLWPARNNWQVYKNNYNLYRNIRLIYNPTKRLVDFYSGVIYPGILSEDGAALPDGVASAIPFSKDTAPELKSAIAQLWGWSNWQAQKSVLVRFGAALGSVFVEITDDLERGKVYAEVQWPGFVRDLQLDTAGNVKRYSLEYMVWNQDKGSYIYRKDVDQNEIRYYRDDELFDYTGYGAVVENAYGFCPAVWIKHRDVGADHGSPAISGAFGKIDELNALVSHVHDQIHRAIGAPAILWSDAANITSLTGQKPRGQSGSFERSATEQENQLILRGPAGGRVDSLLGNLNLADAASRIDGQLAELEKDFPELIFYEQLRQMSQVTGPAANRLLGDAAARVVESMANYDQGSKSLFRMMVAIAGERAKSGAWGALSAQQQKFTPFDLTSYESGDLELDIMPRPLLLPTKAEIAAEKEMIYKVAKYAADAGVPVDLFLKDEGWSEEQLVELHAEQDKQAARIQQAQTLAQADTIPTVAQ